MRRVLTVLAIALLSLPAIAGGPKFSIDGSVVLSSAYLWRGDAVCGLHFNPDVRLHWGNLTLENYDFLAVDGSYKEIDWDLSYKVGDLTFHVADYFFREAGLPLPEDYFNWKMGETTHVDEVAVVYEPSSFPLSAKWFTFFWGDWKRAGGDPVGVSFSSYAELGTYHKFGDYGTLSMAVGASVLPGAYTAYKENFAIIHTELKYSKTFKFEKIKIPVGVTFMVNPYSRTCDVAAAVGLAF